MLHDKKVGRDKKPRRSLHITYYQCLCTLKTYERSKRHTNIQKYILTIRSAHWQKPYTKLLNYIYGTVI